MALISPDYVRTYIRDAIPYNRLLDELEFTDERIAQAKELALDFYNVMSPVTGYTEDQFPSKALLLLGTLWHLFNGEAAMAARNEMSYQDGGLTIPIEERFQYYTALATAYQTQFNQAAQQLKIHQNLESAWGEVRSDWSYFPSF